MAAAGEGDEQGGQGEGEGDQGGAKRIFDEAGGALRVAETVVSALGNHRDNAGVQREGCCAMLNMAASDDLVGAVTSAGGVEAFVAAMAAQPRCGVVDD